MAVDESKVALIDDAEGSGDDNEAEPEDDGVEDEEDSAAEDTVDVPGPTSKAAEVKGGVVPEEDDLDEVEAAVEEDEEDE